VRDLAGGWQRGGGGGSSGARFLRGGADAADAITGFFRGRNLRQKRDDLVQAISASNTARDKLSSLTGKDTSGVASAVLDCLQAESDVNAAAIGILDDQILGVDVQAGTGVARVMADLWDGMAPGGFGAGGNSALPLLAVGGVGLGLGLLLSSRGRRYPKTT
jgi:hypothetical protein